MAKPAFSAPALDSFLDENFPLRSALRQLAEGEESRAFAFDCRGEGFVVRINAEARGFEMDRLIGTALADSAIPVPEVVEIAALDRHFACVSRRLPGETLQALPAGGAFRCGPSVGHTLDRLAGLDAAILDRLASEPQMARMERWSDFLADVKRLEWNHVLPQERDRIAWWTELVVRHLPHLPERRGLVHGDFGSNNVLVRNGTVSGVLDWSEARIGDPLYDLANILFWRSWLDCMKQQCRYFEEVEPWRLQERESLNCYQLRIGLGNLYEAAVEGDARLIDWVLARCSAIAVQF